MKLIHILSAATLSAALCDAGSQAALPETHASGLRVQDDMLETARLDFVKLKRYEEVRVGS